MVLGVQNESIPSTNLMVPTFARNGLGSEVFTSSERASVSVLWIGNANSELEELVQSGQLEGMTFEGVVCKGNICRLRWR